MKKPAFIFFFFIAVCIPAFPQSGWQAVEGKIVSRWSAHVDPANTLPEHPRPQLTRETWFNLNGLWDYAIRSKTESIPTAFDGKILVPFAIESALSGVGKMAGKDNQIWYKRSLTMPATFKNKNVLLHFGAVDWKCNVFVNGQKAGSHQGGYDPFSFDITALLKKSGTNEIIVSVWDPGDEGPQPRGKQVNNPHAIWYTPVSGIWQTVWIEAVPKTYIESTKQTPDIDEQTLALKAVVKNMQAGDMLKIVAWHGTQKIDETEVNAEATAMLSITNPKLWSPTEPFLYNLTVSVTRNGKAVDEVTSYFAMRKISMEADQDGIQRMLLNNEFLFQYGPLDQGWWPDGLYTAPTDEALKFDIAKTKEMGFNMIRKHVKVEPARWYYHCDQLGILVWQDMPSGDMGNRWDSRPGIIGIANDKQRTAESENIFKSEWRAIIDSKYNFPSIVVWVPFNEAWGQFKTDEIARWTMRYDSSRLVNPASGGNFTTAGHIMDLHNYPDPCMPDPKLYGEKQIIVLGEYGGLGLPIEGHTWQAKDNWGYQSFANEEELIKMYESFINRFPELIKKGLSAAVYTQTTDVESEVNGLMTYDRKIVKIPESRLKQIHEKLYSTIVNK